MALDRRPPQIAPYQPRLDWQMWFASMSTPDEYPWTLHLVWKLLHNDPGALSLFGGNPFPEKPPRYIRAVLYRYEFAPPGKSRGQLVEARGIGPLAAAVVRRRPAPARFFETGRLELKRKNQRMVEKKADARENRVVKSRMAWLWFAGGLLAFLSGCASTPPLTAAEKNYPVDTIDARGLFEENCIVCHGRNGKAHTFHGWLVGARNLTNAKWQAETTGAQIVNAIRTGPSVMPAFGKKLSATEIDALALYVRTFKRAY